MMTMEMIVETAESRIRKLIDDRIVVVRLKDADRILNTVASDVRVFDVVNPLRYTGSGAVKKRAEEWFASFEDDIGYEIRDLEISVNDNIAFCHCLTGVEGTLKTGAEVDMWFRTTLCFCEQDGTWLITHEHNSVPFDGESGMVSLGLKP